MTSHTNMAAPMLRTISLTGKLQLPNSLIRKAVFEPVMCVKVGKLGLNSSGIHTASAANAKETIPFEYTKKRKPSFAEKSGDLEGMPKMDLTTPLYPLRESVELQTTDDEAVKKIFSLEFASKQETTKAVKYELVDRIRRHKFDISSIEVQIACLTVKIRSLVVHLNVSKKDSPAKMYLKVLVERRNKFLKHLQQWDYERYEWLLKELNIVYVPHSIGTQVTRKITLREMTRVYCEELRKSRLTEYRQELDAEKESFAKEKQQTLQWIEDEKEALGLADAGQSATVPVNTFRYGMPPLMAEVARIAGETQTHTEQQ